MHRLAPGSSLLASQPHNPSSNLVRRSPIRASIGDDGLQPRSGSFMFDSLREGLPESNTEISEANANSLGTEDRPNGCSSYHSSFSRSESGDAKLNSRIESPLPRCEND